MRSVNRRHFLKIAASVGVTGLLGLSCAVSAKPTNIVLIMADDLGYECIGANGGTSYQTPVLDTIAKTGVRFEHCYAQPLCTPSRVKIMTGKYNFRNYKHFGVLVPDQITFANLLKNFGYATCVVGKWQLGGGPDQPRKFGFDEYCLWQHLRGRTDEQGHDTRYENPQLEINGEPFEYQSGEYGPDVVSDYACDFIDRHKDEPFFLYYPMMLTHCPFVPTPDSDDWDPSSPGSSEYKGDVNYFPDMVAYMDKMIGKIHNCLERKGLLHNTLVIFTGDNGTDEPVVSMFNERKVAGAKGRMTDAGTRVPLIVSWPGTAVPGVISDLVDFSDILPTLCHTAGYDIPGSLQLDGKSFLPQVLGRKGEPRDWIYIWYSRSGRRGSAQVFARTREYKLYQDGRFYHIPNDYSESNDLNNNDLNPKVQQILDKLQSVLDQYKDAGSEKLKY